MHTTAYPTYSRAFGVAFCLIAIGLCFFGAQDVAAATTPDAFNAPTGDLGAGTKLMTGWGVALYWVFMFFKAAAVLMTAWGAFELYKGDLKSMGFSFLAAIVLFFSPAIVDLAFSIGKAAQ